MKNIFGLHFIILSFCFSLSTTQAFASDFPVYRLYGSGDHFYTASLNEAISAGSLGYTYEGVACNLVSDDDARKSSELYRTFNSSVVDHFYTSNVSELVNAISNLGFSYEGVTGFLTSSNIPFYRSYNNNIIDHFYTKDYQEWVNSSIFYGYSLEGSAGNVL